MNFQLKNNIDKIITSIKNSNILPYKRLLVSLQEAKDSYLNYVPNKVFVKVCEKYLDPKKFTNKRALDLGCGTGAALLYLKNNFNMITEGCDRNPDNFYKLNTKYNLGIIESDVTRYPIVGKYDLISCFNVLMWLSEEDQIELLNNINDHLNGLFILSFMTNWHFDPRNIISNKQIFKIFGKPIKIEEYSSHGPNGDKYFELLVFRKK